jgi:hypothetical protein
VKGKFANAYKHWISNNGCKVLFSDDFTSKCLRSTMSKVRRPKENCRFDSHHTSKFWSTMTVLKFEVAFLAL